MNGNIFPMEGVKQASHFTQDIKYTDPKVIMENRLGSPKPGKRQTYHMDRLSQNGFTLNELIMVIALVAIIATLAVPSMKGFIDTSRLKSASEAIAGDLQLARSEAVKRNTSISVNFDADGSSTWCYGIDENTGCDCNLSDPTNASACALPISGNQILYASTTDSSVTPNLSSDYDGIELAPPSFSGNSYTTFSPTRGTASAGTLTLTADNGRILKIVISAIGRVKICTPSASNERVNGYSEC